MKAAKASIGPILPASPTPAVERSVVLPHSALRVILQQTIGALTELDAERLEGLVIACESLRETITADDVRGALSEHSVLEALLAETERNLKFLMRVGCGEGYPRYERGINPQP
jgi:hypothetical protein